MRTIDQLRARIAIVKDEDFFGFGLGDLLIYDADALKPEERDKAWPLENAAELSLKELVSYLPFAFDKAINHRGLSAGRSICHITSWLWLMERDDLLTFAEDDANYRNYGMPILKRMAREFGIPVPQRAEEWIDGRACRPDCEAGCSS